MGDTAMQPAPISMMAKPSYGHDCHVNSDIFDPLSKRQRRIQRKLQSEHFDPMNPNNPKYNVSHKLKKQIHQVSSHPVQSQFVPQPIIDANNNNISATAPAVFKPKVQKLDEDITRMKKPKHEIEVIMDPKLKMLRPSSMRFKRKFVKPKVIPPAKKRKLNIAPDVDKEKNVSNTNSISNSNWNVSENKDAAYDKFMDEIGSLIN